MVDPTDEIPALIVEVASDSTWCHDVNLSDGKAVREAGRRRAAAAAGLLAAPRDT